jgi:hypothetical protein
MLQIEKECMTEDNRGVVGNSVPRVWRHSRQAHTLSRTQSDVWEALATPGPPSSVAGSEMGVLPIVAGELLSTGVGNAAEKQPSTDDEEDEDEDEGDGEGGSESESEGDVSEEDSSEEEEGLVEVAAAS